jgi:hypothetical protein
MDNGASIEQLEATFKDCDYAWLGLCALVITIRSCSHQGIADINGKAVVLLHRFFGKPVRNQSIARLLCLSGGISNAKCWPLPG